MEVKVELPFRQLLKAVKSLTSAQKARLREELDKEAQVQEYQADFIDYLLSGPVYTDEEINMIEENRKSIAEWRKTG